MDHLETEGRNPASERLDELTPLRDGALASHPWRGWAETMGDGRMPGGPSRWNAQKDLSWEPLRIERVIEVEFDQLQSGRFRRVARFIRWRPDREPTSCTYAQLDVADSLSRHDSAEATRRLRVAAAGSDELARPLAAAARASVPAARDSAGRG